MMEHGSQQHVFLASRKIRAVFMGTPLFAARILQALLDSEIVDIAAVYTQPDRPSGRGNRMKPSEVKALALEHGLPVYQPMHFKQTPEGDAAVAELTALSPDVLLVAAYGLLLPQRVLDIPALMPINVHASLLPKYRGAAPIQRAIMEGDSVTGITIMRMEAALDSGPIMMQRAVGIGINDTSADLHDELAYEGGSLLVEALQRLRSGTIRSFPQDSGLATYASKLVKNEAYLNLGLPVMELHARLRGLTPWPGGILTLERPDMPPLAVSVFPGTYPLSGPLPDAGGAEYDACFQADVATEISPGTICFAGQLAEGTQMSSFSSLHEEALLVRCRDGWYAFTEFRPAGKSSMGGKAFVNGYVKSYSGARFLYTS